MNNDSQSKLKSESSKLPIINCHTHIFKESAVPPWIARKLIILWPLTYLPFWIAIIRWKDHMDYHYFRKIKIILTNIIGTLKSSWYGISFYYTLQIFLIACLFKLAYSKLLEFAPYEWIDKTIKWLGNKLHVIDFISEVNTFTLILLIGLPLIILYPKVTKGIFWIASQFIQVLKLLPGKRTLDFASRYFNIVKLALYKNSEDIFRRLYRQYEPGSYFVVLPMDMHYLKAGKPSQAYYSQLQEIINFKNGESAFAKYLLPFIFVHPMRIKKERKLPEPNKQANPLFKWESLNNKITLGKCWIKTCLEAEDKTIFQGVKIYPALGYYPFDYDLLPIYLYCVQNDLPVLTHSIQGTIFYRGNLKKEWRHHPIFTDGNKPLNTICKSNYDVQRNFTHPLNYLVLLDDDILFQWVKKCKDEQIRDLFINKQGNFIKENSLECLKINLAHYGGEEEWQKYGEDDRGLYGHRMITNNGINFKSNDNTSGLNLSSIWNIADWYSIISTLMIKYKNVYADLSYILHAAEIRPLLVTSLNHEVLRKKILFGTDFFVVRNHNTEKDLFANLKEAIGPDLMNQIARDNPYNWLNVRVKKMIQNDLAEKNIVKSKED